MKTSAIITFLLISAVAFGQSDGSKINTKNNSQTSSTSSNEKSSEKKTKSKRKKNKVNPIEELKKSITNSNTTEQDKNTGTKTDLAITDEGAPSDKNNSKPKTAKKTTATQKSESNSNTAGKK